MSILANNTTVADLAAMTVSHQNATPQARIRLLTDAVSGTTGIIIIIIIVALGLLALFYFLSNAIRPRVWRCL